MTPAEGFLSARQAAAYVGYAPADGTRNRDDRQMKAFYAFVSRHKVKTHRRGRCLLFTRADLDRAIGQSTEQHNQEHQTRLERMAERARQHARGESPSCVH